jgi:hypothetical protein
MEERRETYGILARKPEGRRPLGRPRRKWEYNIKMDLQKVGWSVDWFDLVEDRDRRRVPMNAGVNFQAQ